MSELLLELIQSKVSIIKKVSNRKGGEYHSACPRCGGTDRFISFPNQEGGELAKSLGISGTWACPRHCGSSGDVISFLMEFSDLTFKEAYAELKIELDTKNYRKFRYIKPYASKKNINFEAKSFVLPAIKWITQASKLANEAHKNLLNNQQILQYLAKRGLAELAVKQYKLGYIEAEDKSGTCIYHHRSAFALPEKKNKDGKLVKILRIPRGISIPVWDNNGQCLRIRIRKRDIDLDKNNKLDSKYILVPQPEPAYSKPLLLLPVKFSAALCTWVIVESELDAMAIHFACTQSGLQIATLAVLTLQGKPDKEAHDLLIQSPRILVALDFEENNPSANREAFLWWQRQYVQTRIYPVPLGKDPGEAFRMGVNLATWVENALPNCSKRSSRVQSIAFDLIRNQINTDLKPSVENVQITEKIKQVEKAFVSWQKTDELPVACDFTLDFFVQSLQKNINKNEILIPCPRFKWHWLYMSACKNSKRKCYGHNFCLYKLAEKILSEVKND